MSDLKFTEKTRPNTDFVSFYGRPKDMMPELVASGFQFGNYRDLGKARNQKYNSDDKDISLLVNKYFTLAGNPVIGNPKGNDEITIVTDLDHKALAEIKALVAGLNKNTILNNQNALDVPQEMYNSIRNISGATHTLKSSLVRSLRDNAYNNTKARKEIVEAFFQGNLAEAREYIELVKDAHKTKDINGILGFYPGNFTGMRLVWAGSVGYGNAFADSSYGLDFNYIGRLFGVGAGGADASQTKQK